MVILDAPALDSQTPYNFERLLYLISNRNAEVVNKLVIQFQKEGKMDIPTSFHLNATQVYSSEKVLNEESFQAIKNLKNEFSYFVDPRLKFFIFYFFIILILLIFILFYFIFIFI